VNSEQCAVEDGRLGMKASGLPLTGLECRLRRASGDDTVKHYCGDCRHKAAITSGYDNLFMLYVLEKNMLHRK